MDYTLREWVALSRNTSLASAAIKKQCQESDQPVSAVRDTMRRHLHCMMEAVRDGLNENLRSVSGLTGGQASKLHGRLLSGKALCGGLLGKATAYALATAEWNACMGKIVAAPTAGACGILPGALLAMMEERGVTEDQAVDALFVAAAVGESIACQASISGAEGGCQAECGTAAAMAAAALTYLEGGDAQQCVDAAAFAIMNLLGLVCDPVGGLVEVPCVKRNVIGAMDALSAAQMALAGIESRVPPDQVLDAMAEVGRSLPHTLRETGKGGLAATPFAQQYAPNEI